MPRQEQGLKVTLSASALIAKQNAQQKKRHGPAKGKGSSTKRPTCRTFSANIIEAERPKVQCEVCGLIRSMNQSYSNSNIVLHYRHIKRLYDQVECYGSRNGTETLLKKLIKKKKENQELRSSLHPLQRFFTTENVMQVPENQLHFVPHKTIQTMAIVLFGCLSEIPFSEIGSPEFQGLVDLFGVRVQYCSSQSIDSHTMPTYKALCSLLFDKVKKARTR